jgi:hypothetical protein
VRCAPIFLSSLPPPNGALRAPPLPAHRSFAAYFFDPQKYIKSIQLGPPMSRTFFFPLDRRGYGRSPALRPTHSSFADPSGNILGSKLYTGATIRTNFFRFIFSLVFGSLPFVILFFFFSPFQFLLILLLLYFKLFVVLQTCILIIYVHISVILRGFSKGPSFFYSFLLYCTIFFLFVVLQTCI